MKCPNCGSDVPEGDVPFCPHCGQNLAGRRSKRKLRFVLMDVQDDMRFRHLASAAVITVVIVTVLAVLLAVGGTDNAPPSTTSGDGPSDNAIVISDSAYIELGGDFSDGTLSASMSGGELVIRLSKSAASGYDSFDWILRNESNNTVLYNTKETPDITWISPAVGMYTVTVICHSSDTEEEVFIGTMDYRGSAHIQFSFDYGGRGYTVYADVSYEEYSQAKRHVEGRNTAGADAAVGFVSTDGSVATIAERLQTAYTDANPGASLSGADFAGFVLAFVQGCIETGTDTFLYGTAVYWAYPAETLYRGVGDSGDQAVLAASILEACGYDAGIAVIHGHAFVATCIPGFSGPPSVPDGYHTVRIQEGGRQYILTDLTGGYVPIGSIPDAFGYSEGRFTYYGQQSTGDSGMAVAQSL